MGDKMIHLTRFQDVSVSAVVEAADNHSATAKALITGKEGWTVYVQRILISVTTTAATTQEIQDTDDVPIAGLAATPALGAHEWDFGEVGFALTADEGLEYTNSGAGVACAIQVQAYMKRTEGAAVSQAASAA
jgi:hypothetical protein